MNMTHYMELLAVNQPWNLISFMAIPIVLAETLAITELYILFTRKLDGSVYYLNRFAGIVVGKKQGSPEQAIRYPMYVFGLGVAVAWGYSFYLVLSGALPALTR